MCFFYPTGNSKHFTLYGDMYHINSFSLYNSISNKEKSTISSCVWIIHRFCMWSSLYHQPEYTGGRQLLLRLETPQTSRCRVSQLTARLPSISRSLYLRWAHWIDSAMSPPRRGKCARPGEWCSIAGEIDFMLIQCVMGYLCNFNQCAHKYLLCRKNNFELTKERKQTCIQIPINYWSKSYYRI